MLYNSINSGILILTMTITDSHSMSTEMTENLGMTQNTKFKSVLSINDSY